MNGQAGTVMLPLHAKGMQILSVAGKTFKILLEYPRASRTVSRCCTNLQDKNDKSYETRSKKLLQERNRVIHLRFAGFAYHKFSRL